MENKISRVSVIVPVYNEERSIAAFFNELKTSMDSGPWPYEVIFADDASTDKSALILRELFKENNNVKVVLLAANYGQMAAVLAAHSYAKGDVVLTVDCDMQFSATDAHKLIYKIENGYNVVFGYRTLRQDPLFRRVSSRVINKILNFKTGLRIKDWGCPLCCAKDAVFSPIIKEFGLNARFLKQILAMQQKNSLSDVEVAHSKRKYGSSKYSVFNLIRLALDIIINVSRGMKRKNGEIFKIKEALSKEEALPYENRLFWKK